MRLALLLAAAAALAAVPLPASADDGLRWRRTTPRAVLVEEAGGLVLRVPSGRAWGAESSAISVEPARAYRARAVLEVPEGAARGAFLRVAAYARPDARGRQGARFDSPLVTPGRTERLALDFVAPAWARAVKLRVLVRRGADATDPVSAVRARDPGLRRIDRAQPPPVILRPGD